MLSHGACLWEGCFSCEGGVWVLICSIPIYLSLTCAAGRGAPGCDPSRARTVLLHACSAACCGAGSGAAARTADHHVYNYDPARTDHHRPASARAGERRAACRGSAARPRVMDCSTLLSLLGTVSNTTETCFLVTTRCSGTLGTRVIKVLGSLCGGLSITKSRKQTVCYHPCVLWLFHPCSVLAWSLSLC